MRLNAQRFCIKHFLRQLRESSVVQVEALFLQLLRVSMVLSAEYYSRRKLKEVRISRMGRCCSTKLSSKWLSNRGFQLFQLEGSRRGLRRE